jgi:hypothetical protein
MQHEDDPIVDAILATSPFGPEEAVKRYKAIRELRLKTSSETHTVPIAMESLLQLALEEKARRKQ